MDTVSGSPPSIFRNRDFLTIWVGQAVSQVGDRVHNLVLTWWVLSKSSDPAMVGQVLLAATLPQVLFAPLGGTLADRWNRRRILFASDVARGLIVLGLAYLDFEGRLTIPALFAATAVINTISAIFMPTLFAAIPTLVDESQVLKASSMQDAVANGAGIVGPALGGVLVASVGPSWAFALNGLSYLVSGASTLLARIPAPAAGTGGPSVLAQMVDGFLYMRQTPVILGMILVFGLLNFFAAPIAIYLPYYAKEIYGRNADALGWMEACLSVGLVAAGVFLASRPPDRKKAGSILGAILASGLFLVLLGLAPPFGWCLATLLGLGVAVGVANILILVHFQVTVPNERLGRVMGVVTTVTTASQPPAFALAGLLLTRVSVPAMAIVSGTGVFVGALYLLRVPGYREI